MKSSENRPAPKNPAAPESATASMDLSLRVEQLEAEHRAMAEELKALRTLVQRVLEHRQKSHGELVLFLTNLVSRLPLPNVTVLVSQLMEHHAHVSETCAALAGGNTEMPLPAPPLLQALEQTKRELVAALRDAVEELIRLEPPLDVGQLRALANDPEQFFTPAMVRAFRCFLKGQLPRERVVREFGEAALSWFNDLTTDPKLNPRPKPEEIVLAFKPEFEALLAHEAGSLPPEKRAALQTLHQQVTRSKATSEAARAQKAAFFKLSFIVELLHYYEHQNIESPDVVFAQRLPVLLEQRVVPLGQTQLDPKLVAEAESWLRWILTPEQRLMVINNVGKAGGPARTLKFVLRLRARELPDAPEVIAELIKHLVPSRVPPPAADVAAVLCLVPAERQLAVLRALRASDRLPKEQAETLARQVAQQLKLCLPEPSEKPAAISPEVEQRLAWEKIRDMIRRRDAPADIAAAIRERLHVKCDGDTLKQSWLLLTEADPVSLIRIFCNLPYLANGQTDPLAQTAMASYVSRLTHEKYASVYNKVVHSLRNIARVNPHSPTLTNFLALVSWVDTDAAQKLNQDLEAVTER